MKKNYSLQQIDDERDRVNIFAEFKWRFSIMARDGLSQRSLQTSF